MNLVPWVEKYRPSKIEDLSIDENIMNKIKQIIHEKNMPNIIITGAPGIGKTTTILCLAQALLGKYTKTEFLELNASDNRGVKAVNETINFYKKTINIPENIKNQYANHKIILFDEADSITHKAQHLINNLMEKYHNTVRFCFTCNSSSDIIEAIQSRCIIFKYLQQTENQIINKLKIICNKESIILSENDEALRIISMASQGDLRQGINNLQLIYNSYGIINVENIEKLCDRPHPLIIKKIFTECKNKNIRIALIDIKKLIHIGYSASDITFNMLLNIKTLSNTILDEKIKIIFMDKISKSLFIMSKGLDTSIQLTALISSLCE
jgi:replication factor C subunit 2/4